MPGSFILFCYRFGLPGGGLPASVFSYGVVCNRNFLWVTGYKMKRLKVLDAERCVGCQLCMFACQRRMGLGGFAQAAIFPRSRGGLSRGLTVIVCRACKEPPCAEVCPTQALRRRKGGGVILLPQKCIGCGFCRDACPLQAIFWDEGENKPVICIHCGTCADYCPHNVLALVDEEAEDDF